MSTQTPASILAAAIEASPLSPHEIAERAGFENPSILTMIASGISRVPLDRAPALASALELSEQQFLMDVIKAYHPNVYRVLIDVLGLPLKEDELEIVAMYRILKQARRHE